MEKEGLLHLLEGVLNTAANSIELQLREQKLRWNYETGFLLEAMYSAAPIAENEKIVQLVRQSIDSLVDAHGYIAGYRREEFNLDQINPGKLLFRIWKDSKDSKHEIALRALAAQLEYHPRTHCGSFWHKKIYPWQIWLDGLYMFGPWYARYSIEFGKPELLEDLHIQIVNIREHLEDQNTSLYYHGWDESRQQSWANPATGCSSCFWGRALGWLAMALVDIWEIAHRMIAWENELTQMICDLAASIFAYQDSSGLWYQVVDKKGLDGNYFEASASAMFAYFFAKGIRLGLLPNAPYGAASGKAMDGFAEKLTHVDREGGVHLSGICMVAGLGGNPYRDGSFKYYCAEPVVVDDFKGLAALLFAIAESVKIMQ